MPAAPLLWPSVVTPLSEVAAIKELNASLMGVAYNVEAWDAAFQLYQFSKQAPKTVGRDVANRWKFIACHECVMQLYHLKERLQKIKGFKLRGCRTLNQSIDTSRMRKAAKLLDEYFPHIDGLRHAIAHAGENDTNPERHAPDGRFGLVGFRELDRFSAPYEGVIRCLDITQVTLERINEVTTEFFQAFVPAAQKLELQGHLA